MEKFLLKNSNGQRSVTMTAFVMGFIVVNLKLILSGVAFKEFKMAEFSGTEYGIAIGALGSVYLLRRKDVDKKEVKSEE